MSGLRVAARTTSVSRELLSGTALLVRCSNDQAPWRPRSLRNSPPRPCSSGRGHAGQLPPVVSGSGTLAGPGRSPGSTCPAPPGRTRPQAGRAPRQGDTSRISSSESFCVETKHQCSQRPAGTKSSKLAPSALRPLAHGRPDPPDTGPRPGPPIARHPIFVTELDHWQA